MYGFIYLTTNNINGKQYIGQKMYDKNGKWKNYLGSGIYLKKAINKYGKESFSRTILEECATKELLDEREIYWIKYYNAVDDKNFYNIARGGDGGNTLAGYTQEQLEEHSRVLSNALKGVINQGRNNPNAKQVICLNNMQIFDTTIEAGLYANTSDNSIQLCCNGKMYTAGIDPITKEKLQWRYYFPNQKYELKTIQKKPNHPNVKKVICYTTNEIFESTLVASQKYHLSQSGISSCCNFKYSYYGTPKDGEKLQWFYYDYYTSDNFNIKNHPIKTNTRDKKFQVFMYDLNGNYEKEFDSQKDANFFIGNYKNGTGKILQCCRGKNNSAYGHIWRFYKTEKIDTKDISIHSKSKPIK